MSSEDAPTLEDIATAGARRQKAEQQLKQATDSLKALVLAALRDGEHKPTEITKASGWTSAHVRKMARAAGIEPDEKYKERADRLRKSSEETTA